MARRHSRSVHAWFAANEELLITTDDCVDETLTLLVARRHHQRVQVAGRQLFDESIASLHFLTRDLIYRAWILFQQRAAAGWSFTDCTSKIVIDELSITKAPALDDHFRNFGIAIVP